MHTKWGGTEDERVEQILCALSELGARELLVAYEANNRKEPTTPHTYRMDCLHMVPLRKLARCIRGVYRFDKFSLSTNGRPNTIG